MLKKEEVTGGRKKCRAMKSLIICTVHQLIIRMVESTRVWCWACSAYGSRNLNAIIHLENLISIRSKVGCEGVE